MVSGDIEVISIIECVGKHDGGIGYIMSARDKGGSQYMFGYWSNGMRDVVSSSILSNEQKSALKEAVKKLVHVKDLISTYENYKANDNKEFKN